MVSVCVRVMRKEDVPRVDSIAREVFPEEPSPPSFKRLLRDPSRQRFLVACIEGAPETACAGPAPGARGGPDGDRWSWLRRIFGTDHSRPPGSTPAGERVLGYIGMEVDDSKGHIIDIAVTREFQRQGIGELLLRSMIQEALQLGASFLTLEVRVSNHVAQALYSKYGFAKVDRRPDYYIDRNGDKEDGYYMSTGRITSATYQALLEQLKEAPPCIEAQAAAR